MDIVLGVSMTPSTVRMVLVDGKRADGATIEHDTFDIVGSGMSCGQASASATDHVIAAILGTREGAVAGGHRLTCTGVTWTDHAEAADLRGALAARGIGGVTLVSELQAAAALAQAAGSLVGYDKTALLLVGRDAATLSVVDTADGSIVKVVSRPLGDADAPGVLTDMVSGLDDHPSQPDGMFVVGSGHDVAAVRAHVQELVSIPVSAPSDAEMALARGAALAAANIPDFDASTTALAYSQDPDASTSATAYPADLAVALGSPAGQSGRKPFMLVGSTMAAIFMVGVVALVITLAVSIRPTVDSRPNPGAGVMPPNAAAPPAPTVPNAKPLVPPAAVAPPAAPPPPPAAPAAVPALPPIPPPVLAAQDAPPPAVHAPVVQVPVVNPKPAQAAAPAAVPPPVPAAPPPAPVPEASPPAPAPAAVPDSPPTGYPPGYGQPPAYGPGPGYAPVPAYGPGPGYAPVPAYGPGPGYGAPPGYGPVPGYGPGPGYAPASPVIPIIPGVVGIGPRPSYREPGPGWFGHGGYGRGPRWMWPGD